LDEPRRGNVTVSQNLDILVKELKDFYKEFEPRILLAHRRKMERIFRDFEVALNLSITTNDSSTMKGCLETLSALKNLGTHKLDNDCIMGLRGLFTADELATLYKCDRRNIHQRIATQAAREEKNKKISESSFPMPDFLEGKAPEDITDEEAAMVAKLIMIKKVIEDHDIDAAQKLIGNFNQSMRGESLKKWHQLNRLLGFFMEDFIPALKKDLQTAGVKANVNGIVRNLLIKASDDVKTVVQTAMENSKMEDLEKKMKERGKNISKAAAEFQKMKEPTTTPEQE
jgi:hypothetical protein